MMSMARGLRLGNIMYSTRKRKKSKYYDDDSDDSQQQLKRHKLGRKIRGFRLHKCSTGITKQQQEDASTKKKQISRSKKRKQHHNKQEEAHVEPRELLKKGDIVNLSDLLFTKNRDFLVTYNDGSGHVQAKHLEGKVIVLHFVPLVPWNDRLRLHITSLVDIYHALHPKGGFEVVFIGIKYGKFASNPQKVLKSFEHKFSIMPWPAIPFFDIETEEYYIQKLGFPSPWITSDCTTSLVIDPTGVLLQCWADHHFIRYGAEAYPFTDQRIDCIISQDKEALKHPSITTLLTSPERDYVINNDKQVVPVHTLEDKVVGLYFYNDDPNYYDYFTLKLTKAYERFAEEGNFEIVLVYIHNSLDCCERVTEESFWMGFYTMPWLALPFKDPKCMSLQRVFNIPPKTTGPWPDASLVIIGPQGKYVELYGADILRYFGISAYPFTRKRAAQLEAEYIMKLKLNMFWDPNTSFIQKNGDKVKLSQLVGKGIIVIIKSSWIPEDPKFWRKLKARYLQMKGTDDEFEVIHICETQGSNISRLLSRLIGCSGGLLAFDREGRVVRRTIFLSIERGNKNFPFDAGGLEKDALTELVKRFEWDYWDYLLD